MRWYFAIDEQGAAGQTGEDAKLAVHTALNVGGLEPCLLYYGAPSDFTVWMQKRGVEIINTAPSFLDSMNAAQAAGTFKAYSIGHWLRIAIPQVESSAEFVLYTDCDMIFLHPVNWSAIRPKIFAAAPEFKRDNWNYFNSGSMVINVAAMRATYHDFESLIRRRIETPTPHSYDDQQALNEAYRGHWERLDPRLNWKPYWGFERGAALWHFHGPKLSVLEAIAAGRWHDDNPTAVQWRKMVEAHLEGYIAWAGVLGDRLQNYDMALALRLQTAASALTRHRATLPYAPMDTSFMDFCMF
ncbi:MAG: hypothetical protein POG24_03675 [Acidocella sp.]|nr:hypothetical protein [Acidocella sp.]